MRTRRFRPCLLALESRLAPAVTYLVTSTADSGPGSLRQAILSANANPGADVIQFALGSPGSLQTIQLAGSLPAITDTVTIDGRSQGGPGYSGPPLVELRGLASFNWSTCLTVQAPGCAIQGLVINGQWGTAIEVAAPRTVVRGNYLGSNAEGTAVFGELGDGFVREIVGYAFRVTSSHNVIGGTSPSDRNILGTRGEVLGAGAHDNVIQGNYFGVDVTGTRVLRFSNGQNWLHTLEVREGASDNLIGGTIAAARNLFAFSGRDPVTGRPYPGTTGGVVLTGPGTSENAIQGNFFGVDAAGTTALAGSFANDVAVIIERGASHNLIGGEAPGAGNLIAGLYQGITVSDPGSDFNVIQGNLIGTDVTGTVAIRIYGYGINLQGRVRHTRIGGASPGARNVIAGFGIGAIFGYADFTIIQGNYLGTDVTGTRSLVLPWYGPGGAHFEYGIDIHQGEGNVIGGAGPGEGNLIVATQGVTIQNSRSNLISGNWIGVDAFGREIPDYPIDYGVMLFGESSNNVIGGSAPGAGNLIAHYDLAGVVVGVSGYDNSVGNLILGNTFRGGHGLPIDLALNGVTANSDQAQVGPNRLQPYPILDSAVADETGTTVTGTLQSIPNKQFRIEIYAQLPGSADLVPIGAFDLTTDSDGFARFVFTGPPQPVGTLVRATATDETSEFSPGLFVTARSLVGNAGGSSDRPVTTGGSAAGPFAPSFLVNNLLITSLQGGADDPVIASGPDAVLASPANGLLPLSAGVGALPPSLSTVTHHDASGEEGSEGVLLWGAGGDQFDGVVPELAGQEIIVEANRDGTWVGVGRGKADAQGRFSFRGLTPGSYRVRPAPARAEATEETSSLPGPADELPQAWLPDYPDADPVDPVADAPGSSGWSVSADLAACLLGLAARSLPFPLASRQAERQPSATRRPRAISP